MSNIWLTAYELSLWILIKQAACLNISCPYFKDSVKTPMWRTITVATMQTLHTWYTSDSLCKKLEFTVATQCGSVLCCIGYSGDYQLTLTCTVPRGVKHHPRLRCSCNRIDKICANQAISWAISWVLLTDTLK